MDQDATAPEHDDDATRARRRAAEDALREAIQESLRASGLDRGALRTYLVITENVERLDEADPDTQVEHHALHLPTGTPRSTILGMLDMGQMIARDDNHRAQLAATLRALQDRAEQDGD